MCLTYCFIALPITNEGMMVGEKGHQKEVFSQLLNDVIPDMAGTGCILVKIGHG